MQDSLDAANKLSHYANGYSEEEADYWNQFNNGVDGLGEKIDETNRRLITDKDITIGIGNSDLASAYTKLSETLGTILEIPETHDAPNESGGSSEEKTEEEKEIDLRQQLIQMILEAIRDMTTEVITMNGTLGESTDAVIADYTELMQKIIDESKDKSDETLLQETMEAIKQVLLVHSEKFEDGQLESIFNTLNNVITIAKESGADFSSDVVQSILGAASQLITADEITDDNLAAFQESVTSLFTNAEDLNRLNNAELASSFSELKGIIASSSKLDDQQKEALNDEVAKLVTLFSGLRDVDFANEGIAADIIAQLKTFMGELKAGNTVTDENVTDVIT